MRPVGRSSGRSVGRSPVRLALAALTGLAALAAGCGGGEVPPTSMTLMDARDAAPDAVGPDDERGFGLVIVAPPVDATGRPALRALGREIAAALAERLRASDSVRFVPVGAADSAAREPAQVLRTLRRSDAQVAVRTTYYDAGDSVRVQVAFARRVPPPPKGARLPAPPDSAARAAAGSAPREPRTDEVLETWNHATVAAPIADRRTLLDSLGATVERALVSMTTCGPRPAAPRDAVPWCWTKRGKTRPVPARLAARASFGAEITR